MDRETLEHLDTPRLEADEERDLVARARAGDRRARDRVLTAHFRLARRWAREYAPRTRETVSALFQEGVIALSQALDRYDPAKGVRFGAYAQMSVKGAIGRHASKNASIVGADGDVAREAFFAGRVLRDVDLDAPVSASDEDGDGETLGDLLRAEGPSPEEQAVAALHQERLVALMLRHVAALSERERTIIGARFLEENPAALKDVAALLGVSSQRVSQIEHEALDKLRKRVTWGLAIPRGPPNKEKGS